MAFVVQQCRIKDATFSTETKTIANHKFSQSLFISGKNILKALFDVQKQCFIEILVTLENIVLKTTAANGEEDIKTIN